MRTLTTTLIVLMLATTACTMFPGKARMVQRNQTGGVIALEGNHDTALTKAQEAMTAHCGAYEIVDEREVVVGSDEVTEGKTSYNKLGTSDRSGTSTRDATEYRITYRCTATAPATTPATQGRAPGQVPPAAMGTNR